MRYLSLAEVVELHRQVIARSGGASGIRDLGVLHAIELTASVDEAEATIMRVASGASSRHELTQWVEHHSRAFAAGD